MGRPPAGMIDAMTKHLIRRLRADHGQEDGDPDRAAQVILDVVDLDEPPLRLLSAEDRKWAFLSERTDFQEVAA